jgi:adenine phosphoribosyltransferase
MDISKFYSRVPDWPVKGNVAADISQLLVNPEVFSYSVEWLIELTNKYNIDNIVAIETRGSIWASPLAFAAKLPLHLARKPLRIPRPVAEVRFITRKRHYSLNIQKDANISGNVIVIDDIMASGSTHLGVGELLTEHFGVAPSNQLHASIIEIKDHWVGRQILLDKGYAVESLMTNSAI